MLSLYCRVLVMSPWVTLGTIDLVTVEHTFSRLPLTCYFRGHLISTLMDWIREMGSPWFEEWLNVGMDVFEEESWIIKLCTHAIVGGFLVGPLECIRTRVILQAIDPPPFKTPFHSLSLAPQPWSTSQMVLSGFSYAIAAASRFAVQWYVDRWLDLGPKRFSNAQIISKISGLFVSTLLTCPLDMYRYRVFAMASFPKMVQVGPPGLRAMIASQARDSQWGILGGIVGLWKGFKNRFLAGLLAILFDRLMDQMALVPRPERISLAL